MAKELLKAVEIHAPRGQRSLGSNPTKETIGIPNTGDNQTEASVK